MVPPVVLALLELLPVLQADLHRPGRVADGPGGQVDDHDEEDGEHPLEKLLVGQLQLVGRLDTVGQADSVKTRFNPP